MFCPGKVMPCFDQPDLKSNMTLIVYTHEMWQAASVADIEGVSHMVSAEVKEAFKEESWLLDFVQRDLEYDVKRV